MVKPTRIFFHMKSWAETIQTGISDLIMEDWKDVLNCKPILFLCLRKLRKECNSLEMSVG